MMLVLKFKGDVEQRIIFAAMLGRGYTVDEAADSTLVSTVALALFEDELERQRSEAEAQRAQRRREQAG